MWLILVEERRCWHCDHAPYCSCRAFLISREMPLMDIFLLWFLDGILQRIETQLWTDGDHGVFVVRERVIARLILYSINQQNANSVAVVLFIIVHHKIFQIHHRRCSVLFRCYPSQIRFVHDVVSQPLIFPSKTICRGDLTVISHSLLFRREPECVPHNTIHYNVRPKRTNQKNPCGTEPIRWNQRQETQKTNLAPTANRFRWQSCKEDLQKSNTKPWIRREADFG